jgi:hypothetical protein
MIYIAFSADGHPIGYGSALEVFDRAAPAPEGFVPERDLPRARLEDGQVILTPLPPPRSGLTHQGFRRLLTLTEQLVLDNYANPAFVAAHPALKHLDVMTLAILNTAYKTYEGAQEIDLDDPAVPRFIGLLAQLGLLDGEGRVERILSGQPPED